MKRTVIFVILFLAFGSTLAQTRQESSGNGTNDEVVNERLRRLQEIQALRAEAQRQAQEAERRLAVLGAKRGIRPDGTAISWPEAVITVINSNWVRPPVSETGTTGCKASIVIDRNGEVISIDFEPICSPAPLKHSIENAIIKSSPLPLPNDQSQFSNKIIARFVPQDEA